MLFLNYSAGFGVGERALSSSAPGSNCLCIATSAAVAEDAAELYRAFLNNETL